MSTPVDVQPFTQDVYDRLPEVYRDLDGDQGYALLRFLSLVLDHASRVGELLDGFDPEDGSLPSLVDAGRADAAWLPWLAGLLGLRDPGATPAQLRARLAEPEVEWQHGSTTLLRSLVERAAGGTGEVIVTSEWAAPSYEPADATYEDSGSTYGDLGGRPRVGEEDPWVIYVWAESSAPITLGQLEDAVGGRVGGFDQFPTGTALEGLALVLSITRRGEAPAGWVIRPSRRRPIAAA